MTEINVTFLIPGFLNPDALSSLKRNSADLTLQTGMDWSAGGALRPWQAHLLSCLSGSEVSGLQLPAARLQQRHLDTAQGIVCADPVHLQADRDTARLLPSEVLEISEQESEQLLADLNAFLIADGLTLYSETSGGWYLTGMDASQLESLPPSFLAHRSASAFMPGGQNSEPWQRLMTELQMLLHTHPVNVARQERGALTVNSLWFWGGGAIDPALLGENTLSVYADADFCVKFCEAYELSCRPLSEFDPNTVGRAVVVDQRIATAVLARDEDSLIRGMHDIDHAWLEPLSQRLGREPSGLMVIENEDGECGLLKSEHMMARQRASRFPNGVSALFGKITSLIFARP